jgi:hypothetical protein
MIMRPRHRGTIIISIGLAYLGLMMLFSGCTKRVSTEPTGEEGPTPIVTAREFPDVPIPKELKLDAKESFVIKTPEFATGMLVYNGNVDYESLVRFFDEYMPQKGWIIQAKIKYARSLFFYQKENRICLVTMQETPLNVRVEIWVVPLETTAYEPLLMEPPIEPIEPAMQ